MEKLLNCDHCRKIHDVQIRKSGKHVGKGRGNSPLGNVLGSKAQTEFHRERKEKSFRIYIQEERECKSGLAEDQNNLNLERTGKKDFIFCIQEEQE